MNKIMTINSRPIGMKFAEENCWICINIRNHWNTANFSP